MKPPRVLVTGPLASLSEYAEAARAAGWEAIELPLLRVEPAPLDPARIAKEGYAWICVTSASALPFLEAALSARPTLRGIPCAAVGERTARRVEALGLVLSSPPAEDATALADRLLERAQRGARILWPRGSLSDDLARRLREGGLSVDDPIAYTTRPIEGEERLPEADAVFFASPSAVHTWQRRAEERASRSRVAIAIGRTTFDALLQETGEAFFDTISLPRPTPEAFGVVLAHLDIETHP